MLAASFAPDLDAETAWRDQSAWAGAPSVELRGVDGTKADPATVRARWNEEALFFEFTCRDRALVAPGREDQMNHFQLGDVVEIFLGARGCPSYLEVHATPAGRRSVYFFRDRRQPAPGREARGIEVRADRIRGGWRALMVIPWKMAGGAPRDGNWEFLAGRYDYDKPDGAPVLSSYPAQRGRADFHDRARFSTLELRP